MSDQLPVVRFALPELTPALGAPEESNEIPLDVHRRLRDLATSGLETADAHLAALWLLLRRYARDADPPGELVVLGRAGERRRLLTGWPEPTDTFGAVVAALPSALVDPASGPGARPHVEPGLAGAAVVFACGTDVDEAQLPPAPRLVLRVTPEGPEVQVRVESEGLPAVLAAAVASDHARLLAALATAQCAVCEVDAFATDWAGPAAPAAPECGGLHDVVLAHAERTPDAVAVRGRTALTYRDLVQRSEQLCGLLIAQGVSSEDRVGLCVERDERLAVGVLGVLMSGAAFVPLSPEDPPLRRRELIADAQISVVVADDGLADDLGGEVTVVALEDADGVAAARPAPTAAGTAAYVLYTSGSSGKPKGVVVEHRQLLAYGSGFLDRLGHHGALTCAMVQPLSVDSSLTCVAGAWMTGGEFQVIDRATALDRSRLVAWQTDHRADVLKIAPSHLRALQSAGDLAALAPRVALVVGGEASDWDWLQRVQDQVACPVHNHYGPTETTVGVLMLPVAAHRGRKWTTAALGDALTGCHVAVVDRFGMEAPAGIQGELVVRGPLVARGYQVEPVTSGFRPWRGVPAYWTGDQGRRERDGVICFAGRSDDQVKVRGYRVELGDVEQVVARFPGVDHAVALVSTDLAGWASVGCAVQPTGGRLQLHEIVEHCRTLLPEHMIPTRWLVVDDVPRTPHGKVDRAALRGALAEQGTAAGAGPGVNASVDEGELTGALTEIWREVLGGAVVAQQVNFFDAGGHSLLLVDLQRLIAERTGREVELLDLFRYPTIAAQGELLLSGAEVRRPADTGGRRRRQQALARRRSQQLRRGGRDHG